MGVIISCVEAILHGIGAVLMAIVNGIATVLMAIVHGVAAFFDALISCLTCGGCGRGRSSRVGAAY